MARRARRSRDDVVFEKGFPARIVATLVTPNQCRIATGNPVWALHAYRPDSAIPENVLFHPVMGALEELVNLSRESLHALVASRRKLPWKTIGYVSSFYADSHASDRARNDADRYAIARLYDAAPNLECLELSGYSVGPAQFEWLWHTDVGKHLARFSCESPIALLPKWVEDLRPRDLPNLTHFSTSRASDLTGGTSTCRTGRAVASRCYASTRASRVTMVPRASRTSRPSSRASPTISSRTSRPPQRARSSRTWLHSNRPPANKHASTRSACHSCVARSCCQDRAHGDEIDQLQLTTLPYYVHETTRRTV
jgi:hypothetical protein